MAVVLCLLGALLGLLAVALGAFGAHALKAVVTEDLVAAFETGVRYQMYHALALLGAGLSSRVWPGPWFRRAGWLFAIGILLFSGSLYLLALTGTRWLGAVTPVGGLALMGGWALFGAGLWKAHRAEGRGGGNGGSG